jgi:hypothetical protein
LKYDGMPFSVEEVERSLKKFMEISDTDIPSVMGVSK